MCIRDSYHSLLLGFVATMFVLSFTAVASEVLEGDTHPIDCLLYTSDAADERSSVDLGGRRIIKKKK